MKKNFFALLLLSAIDCYAPYMTISQPGLYVIGEDVSFAPSTADSAIIIASNDVVLDLGQRVVAQTNITAGVNGIVVNPGFSNIIIRNGTLSNFIDTSALISAGTNILSFENILITGQTNRAIDLAGTAANPIQNVQINNTIVSGCTGYTTLLTLTQCTNVTVNNCTLNNNQTAKGIVFLTRVESCRGCKLQNIEMRSNNTTIAGGVLTGLDLNNTGSCIFMNCTIQQSTATNPLGGTIVGIMLRGATQIQVPNALNMFIGCNILENTAQSSFTGIDVLDNALQNTFLQCKVIRNQVLAGNIRGIECAILSTGVVTENAFIECMIANNRATTAADGFSLNGANFGSIIRCLVQYNSATAGIAAGLTMAGSGCNRWAVIDSTFTGNTGSSAANSFGVRQLVGSNVLFSQIISFNNGTTQANQLSGVISQATIGSPQTNNMNTPTGDWTNVPVAS